MTDAPAAQPPPAALAADLQTLIDESGADTVAVAFHDLLTGDEWSVNGDVPLHPASTIKVPILVELYKQTEAGALRLDDRIPITNDFPSSLDGSRFTLSASDDSDKTLYARLGERETLYELARLMIVRSSNLGTNLLIDRLTPEAVTATMREIGADGLLLRNRMMDMKAYDAGKTNLGTARGLSRLFTLLAQRAVVSPAASDAMLEILFGQEFRQRLPGLLPPDVRVAHKTGSISRICHDAGIVYLPNRPAPYVLAVMTRGIEDEKAAARLIAAISRRVYDGILAADRNPV